MLSNYIYILFVFLFMSDILIKLLKKYDLPARDTTLKYIKNTVSNSDIYGVDVLLKNCKYLSNIEVQTLTISHL